MEKEIDPSTKEELEIFAAQQQRDLNFNPHQKLLIIAAYITEPSYKHFKKYPDVIVMGSTHGTNEERRELFLMSAKYRRHNVFSLAHCLSEQDISLDVFNLL